MVMMEKTRMVGSFLSMIEFSRHFLIYPRSRKKFSSISNQFPLISTDISSSTHQYRYSLIDNDEQLIIRQERDEREVWTNLTMSVAAS